VQIDPPNATADSKAIPSLLAGRNSRDSQRGEAAEMAKRRKKTEEVNNDTSILSIYGKTIDEAVRSGFLFGFSINHYENRTRKELIEKGYNEVQVDVAEMVLAHFQTSVGAKLGRCKPELWNRRPCADCGKTVDTSKFNTLPSDAAVLCKACKRKRDSVRVCTNCSQKYHDPSLDRFVVNPFVKRHGLFAGHPYLCSWCALFRGDMTFIRDRTPGSEQDRKILTTQLNLVKREGLYPTTEEFERERREIPEVDYIHFPRHKKDIIDKFLRYKSEDIDFNREKFFIRYTGYVWRTYKESPPEDLFDTPYLLIEHPNDPLKIVMICRMQFFNKSCQGYVETLWQPWPRSLNFINLNPKNVRAETEILQQVSPLIFNIERESQAGRGEKKGSYSIIEFIVEKGRMVWSSNNGEVTKHSVARACGGRYGISAEGNRCNGGCHGCKAIDRNIKRYNPTWTWRENILPLIEAPLPLT
jgi:hypothetical protein